MKEYTIYAGKKLIGLVDDPSSVSFECDPNDIDTQASVSFECDPNDIDTAYDALAESCILKDMSDDSQDLIDFEDCEDDDVETMLQDLKRMHFLSDYDISDSNE